MMCGRPKPTILMDRIDKRHRAFEILDAEAVWAVFYDGKPISLRTRDLLVNLPGPKYPRCFFGNEGHAHLLCKKLVARFKDNKFQVYKLTTGEPVPDRGPRA